jgi:hypothetical protein
MALSAKYKGKAHWNELKVTAPIDCQPLPASGGNGADFEAKTYIILLGILSIIMWQSVHQGPDASCRSCGRGSAVALPLVIDMRISSERAEARLVQYSFYRVHTFTRSPSEPVSGGTYALSHTHTSAVQ